MTKTLIVDDMKEVYDKISKHFGENGYAPTLNDAIKEINSGKYDKVITDYHLGDDAPQGGLEVARTARDRGLSVILMSRENHREEARKLDVDFKFKKELIENGIEN